MCLHTFAGKITSPTRFGVQAVLLFMTSFLGRGYTRINVDSCSVGCEQSVAASSPSLQTPGKIPKAEMTLKSSKALASSASTRFSHCVTVQQQQGSYCAEPAPRCYETAVMLIQFLSARHETGQLKKLCPLSDKIT